MSRPETTKDSPVDPEQIARLQAIARTRRQRYEAETGQIWVCRACGKTARNRVGGTKGWDESCAANAVLWREASLVRGGDGYVIKADVAMQ